MRFSRWRRPVAVLAAAAGMASLLAGCGAEEEGEQEVLDAIEVTRLQPYRFTYQVENPEGAFEVQGLIEDDFRYKTRLASGTTPIFDEVVNDDAVAVRFLQPDAIGNFVDDAQVGEADIDTELAGIDVYDALEARRWVLDVEGAPSLTGGSRAADNVGEDPIFDALGIFNYLEQAMSEAFQVEEFNPDSLNPAYVRSEDPFPRPERNSDITRYDLRRPFLPPIGASGGATTDVPETRHFRKMAIYVRDGFVVRVLERIEVTGRSAQDFIDYSRRALQEFEAPQAIIDSFDAEIDLVPEEDLSDTLLEGLNQNLQFSGGDPIDIRGMNFILADIGDEDIVADLPTDVILASLAVLVNRGDKAVVDDAGEQVTAGDNDPTGADAAGPTTTTLPSGGVGGDPNTGAPGEPDDAGAGTAP